MNKWHYLIIYYFQHKLQGAT